MGKKKSTAKKPAADAASFEESLAALEQIVAKLEGGRLELADSLDQYERGVQHLKTCYALLSDAERRIELVQEVDSAGNAQTAPLDETSDDLSEKRTARQRRRTAASPNPRRANDVDDGSSLF